MKPKPVKLTGFIGLDVYRAGRAGKLDLCRRLIDRFIEEHGDIEALFRTDRYGGCPFSLWADAGASAPEILELIRPHGIRWTAWTAAAWGQIEELDKTLEDHPEHVEQTRWCGTPLHWAFAYGRLEAATWLIDRFGIDLASTEGRGYVNCTLRAGDDAVRLAVARGADVDYDQGQTALQHQCKHGRTTCVATLLELGADPDRPRQDTGRTSLHLAAKTGICRKLIHMLLEAGANPALKDDAGKTALDLAKEAKRPTAARTLEEWGERRHG